MPSPGTLSLLAVLGLSANGAQPAEERFARAERLLSDGRFVEAAAALEEVLESDPTHDAAREALGVAYFRAGEPAEAAAVLAPLAAGSASPSASVLSLYGNALAEAGRSADAIAPLEAALALEPERVLSLFLLGRALLDVGRLEDAAARFRGGVDLPPPHNIRFEVGVAEAELRLGRSEEAGKRLASLLERHPRAARGWYLKGALEAQRGRYAEAATAFRRAIDHGYGGAQGRLDLGIALASSGDSLGAREAIDEALALDPNLAAAHYYRGLMFLEDGDALREPEPNRPNPFRAEAEAAFDRASVSAAQPGLLLSLAEAYAGIRRFERAVELARRLTESSSGALAAQAFYVIARAQHDQLALDAAESSYREAIERGLDSADVHLNLGRLHMAAGRLDDARHSLERAIGRDPTMGPAHLQLGLVVAKLAGPGAAADALEHLGRAVELLPDDAEAWYQLGIAQSQAKRPEEAVRSWARAIAIDETKTSAYFRLGNELVKLGRAEEGKVILEEFRRRSDEEKEQTRLASRMWPLLRSGQEAAEAGRLDEARADFEEALSLAPGEAPPYLFLAELQLGSDRALEARATLLAGIERLPENVHLRKLLIRVYESSGDETAAERERHALEEIVRRVKSP